ncbi:MAG: type II CAAX prenyl endopeptidase Rce1 family protein [Capsulimonadaceae bacterium]
MRVRMVREIFLKELREALRDRRSLMALFGLPLFLYPLIFFAAGTLGVSTVKKISHTTYAVAVTNATGAPQLQAILNLPDSGLRAVAVSDPARALHDGAVSAVIAVPPNFEAGAIAGLPAGIRVEVDRSKTATGYVEDRVGGVLSRYEHWIIAQRLTRHHLPSELGRPISRQTLDVESGGDRVGVALVVVLPTLLLLTGLVASLSTALVATTSEREAGSMESLLVTPVRKLELLVGKTILVFLAAVFATTCNLISMSLVLWRVTKSAPHGAGAALDPSVLGLSLIAVLPTLLFISAVCLIIGLSARSYREASSYAQFPVLCTMLPMMINLLDPKSTPAMLATPVVNTSIVIRHILLGRFAVGEYSLAAAFSTFWALVMLAFAARLFNAEQLVNVDWEPLSMMRRRRHSRPARLPTIDEGLLAVGLSLLLIFYVGPDLVHSSLLKMTVVTEIVLIAGPAILMAQALGYRWIETFSLRAPGIWDTVGGVLLGLGAVGVVAGLQWLQNRVWPEDPATQRALRDAIGPALMHSPVIMAFVVGGLAGIGEETLFRGPVLQSLLRRMPAWGALLVSGALFAAVHMDLHGLILRTLLGMLLGWIVIRTGSIVPAMIAHGLYDTVTLLVAGYMVHRYGLNAAFSSSTDIPVLPLAAAAGLVVMVLGKRLIDSSRSASFSEPNNAKNGIDPH